MACMEHICFKCNWWFMDNTTRKLCPKCGTKIRSYFDEEADHHDTIEEESFESEE